MAAHLHLHASSLPTGIAGIAAVGFGLADWGSVVASGRVYNHLPHYL